MRDYILEGWQRSTKWKYALRPLDPTGSLVNPGGRFNVGEIDRVRYPAFRALYLATNKDTALQETLGTTRSGTARLTAREIALTAKDSISCVSVHGQLESVIDISKSSCLKPFCEVIKRISLSKRLMEESKRLHDEAFQNINSLEGLLKSLLDPQMASDAYAV